MNVHDFRFDLHDIPEHPEALGEWLDQQTPDDYDSWPRSGVAARLLRRLDEAEHALAKA